MVITHWYKVVVGDYHKVAVCNLQLYFSYHCGCVATWFCCVDEGMDGEAVGLAYATTLAQIA